MLLAPPAGAGCRWPKEVAARPACQQPSVLIGKPDFFYAETQKVPHDGQSVRHFFFAFSGFLRVELAAIWPYPGAPLPASDPLGQSAKLPA